VVKVVGAGGVRREGLAACGGDAKTEAEKTWIGCNRSDRPRSRERMRGSASKATGGKADPSGSCGRVSGEASEGGLTRGSGEKKSEQSLTFILFRSRDREMCTFYGILIALVLGIM
jgi:hypothetical protein